MMISNNPDDDLTPHQKAILSASVEDLAREALAGWDLNTMKQTSSSGGYSIKPLYDTCTMCKGKKRLLRPLTTCFESDPCYQCQGTGSTVRKGV